MNLRIFSACILFLYFSCCLSLEAKSKGCIRRIPEKISVYKNSASLPSGLQKSGYRVSPENWPSDVRINLNTKLWLETALKNNLLKPEEKPLRSKIFNENTSQYLIKYTLGASALCVLPKDIKPNEIKNLWVIASGYDTSTQVIDGVPLTSSLFDDYYRMDGYSAAVCLIDLPAQGLNFIKGDNNNLPVFDEKTKSILAPCLADFANPFNSYYENYDLALSSLSENFLNAKINIVSLSIATLPMLKAALNNSNKINSVYLLSPYTGEPSEKKIFAYKHLVSPLARFSGKVFFGGNERSYAYSAIHLSHNKKILETEVLRLFTENGAVTEQVNPTYAFINNSGNYLNELVSFVEKNNKLNNFKIFVVVLNKDKGIVNPEDSVKGLIPRLEKAGLQIEEIIKLGGDGHNMLTEPVGINFLRSEILGFPSVSE